MKSLRVLGTKPKNHPFPILSWLIRLIEWSKISHVAIELIDEKTVIHSHFNSIEYIDIDDFEKENTIVYSYSFDIPTESYEAMLYYFHSIVGLKKGYFKILFGAIIPHLLRCFFNIYIRNLFASEKDTAQLCSQFVRKVALRYWNFKVPSRPFPENFSTQDVIALMENNIKK